MSFSMLYFSSAWVAQSTASCRQTYSHSLTHTHTLTHGLIHTQAHTQTQSDTHTLTNSRRHAGKTYSQTSNHTTRQTDLLHLLGHVRVLDDCLAVRHGEAGEDGVRTRREGGQEWEGMSGLTWGRLVVRNDLRLRGPPRNSGDCEHSVRSILLPGL